MLALPRIRSLETRHQALETRIADETLRPRPDTMTLSRLKREKLAVKQEMEKLRQLN